MTKTKPKLKCVHVVCGSECELVSTGDGPRDCRWWICRTCQKDIEDQTVSEYLTGFDDIDDCDPEDDIWRVSEVFPTEVREEA